MMQREFPGCRPRGPPLGAAAASPPPPCRSTLCSEIVSVPFCGAPLALTQSSAASAAGRLHSQQFRNGLWPPSHSAAHIARIAFAASVAAIARRSFFDGRRSHKRDRRHSVAAVKAHASKASADNVKTSGRADSWLGVVQQVIAVAVPTIFSNICQLANEQTNTIFLGHMADDAALAAQGLGNMMQNCFGLSVGWGILAALDPLVSQSSGAGQAKLATTFLQRGRVLASLQLFWIVPLLFCTESILVRLGQDPLVAGMAASYNRSCGLALFALFQYQASAKFLQNQCVTIPPMVIALICCILHVGWCWLFIGTMGLGNAGAGFANATTWLSEWLFISLYLFMASPRLGFRRYAVLGLEPSGIQQLGSYLRIAVPCVLQVAGEWWFWEICALVAGGLGTVQLAAHVATNQVVGLVYMPASGLATAGAALVGNAMGANEPGKAKRLVITTIALNLIGWSSLAFFIFRYSTVIANIYVRQGEVLKLMEVLLLIYAIAGFADTTQGVMSGLLRGMGKIAIPSIVYILAYYGLMLPSGYLLATGPFGLGVHGLWYAFGLGTSVAVLVFSFVLCRVRYQALAARISGEVAAKAKARDQTSTTKPS